MAWPVRQLTRRSASVAVLSLLLFFPSCIMGQIFKAEPSTITEEKRNTWCAMELDTCTLLCDQGAMSSQDNLCDPTTLEYKCHCKTWDPPMERYEHTLPTFMCENTYQNCMTTNRGDVAAQNNCTVTIKRFCGDLAPAPGGPAPSPLNMSTSAGTSTSTTSTNNAPTGSLDLTKELSSSSSSSPSPSSQDQANNDDNDDEHKGVKIGIAIGAVTGIGLAGSIMYLFRFRRKLKARAAAAAAAEKNPTHDDANNSSGDSSLNYWGGELQEIGVVRPGGRSEFELDGISTPVELEQPGGVRMPAVELDATGSTFDLGKGGSGATEGGKRKSEGGERKSRWYGPGRKSVIVAELAGGGGEKM